jgi:hypothetical protein
MDNSMDFSRVSFTRCRNSIQDVTTGVYGFIPEAGEVFVEKNDGLIWINVRSNRRK